jgi:hypothetical protein
MYDLARKVGLTACQLLDSITSACTSDADVTALGFVLIVVLGVGGFILAVARVDRIV